MLITSSDAVVSIGGRLGTLHEFTIAMETDTPIGFLQGAGGVSEEIQDLMALAHPLRHGAFVTFDEDADKLVTELTNFLDVSHKKYHTLYQ